MVLEQVGGSLDGIGLDDNVAAGRIHGVGDAVLCNARRSADHAAAIREECGISLLPVRPPLQADSINRILLWRGQAAKAGKVFGLQGVDGKKAGHTANFRLAEALSGYTPVRPKSLRMTTL